MMTIVGQVEFPEKGFGHVCCKLVANKGAHEKIAILHLAGE
jgi:hypothetical protein